MKKSIYFFTMLLGLALFTNCSKDDNSSNENNKIYQKLIGKWYFDDPSTNPTMNNSFTFNSGGEVTYSYWSGGSANENEYDSETGSFSVNNDILTMIFPETVTLTFIQKVVFIDDNTVRFVEAEGSNEEPYKGTYYKAN